MYHLTKEFKPPVCIEIGVEDGIGSAHMCAAAAEYGGIVVGVDRNASIYAAEINKAYGNYLYIIDDSVDAFMSVVENINGKVGLVYQDSSHHYEASHKEFALYSTLLTDEPIWICDDVTPAFHDPNVDPPGKGMIQYFDELPGDKRLYTDVLHHGSTQGIILL